MKNVIVFALAFISGGLFADYDGTLQTIYAWRGESRVERVNDNVEAEFPEAFPEYPGVTVKFQRLAPVAYLADPAGERYEFRLDRFIPMAASETGPLVAEVSVAADAKPGSYKFGALEVKVSERVLPPAKEWKYFLDLWQHPWAVSRFFKLEPFSEDHYAAMEPIWRTIAECGQKTLTVSMLEEPWNHQCYDAYHSMIGRVKKDDGTWSFDYKLFDKYVEFGRKCGLGPKIACYTMCPWGYIVRWQNEKGETCKAKAVPGTPEFEEFWGEFLVDFAAHLKEKGWFEDAYIAMDERTPEDVMNIANFIQKKVPGMKISMAGNRRPSDFKGIVIDNYSQYISHMEDAFLDEVSDRRTNGYVTTFYVCCGPDRPNTFMSSRDDEAIYLGSFPAFMGLDGLLRWAANSWPKDPYADASCGTWAAGDTYLVYPDGSPSIRLAYLKRGIIAAEKIRILREAGVIKDEEIAKLRKDYGYQDAMNGKFAWWQFRLDLGKLINDR